MSDISAVYVYRFEMAGGIIIFSLSPARQNVFLLLVVGNWMPIKKVLAMGNKTKWGDETLAQEKENPIAIVRLHLFPSIFLMI